MTHPYADSPYAYERVGLTLHCEPDPEGWPEIKDGDMPKCVHCREDYEHQADNPHPCIERIAEALEEARRNVDRLLDR